MSAKILSGKQISAEVKNKVKLRIDEIKKKLSSTSYITPTLAVIIVGDDPASKIYVENKKISCKQVGIESKAYHLDENTTQQDLIILIEKLNNDQKVHGILVQLPLPDKISSDAIIEKINPHKDVDGFHPCNVGKLALRVPEVRPCTPYGIMHLICSTGVNLKKSHAVVVGASNIVGRPMALELLLAGCTISVCHRFTPNSKQITRQADIVIVAVGHPNFVTGDWIKKDAIVIDVGINRDKNNKICGDVDFESCLSKAGYITPVPGGVGLMTVAMLMLNTLKCYENMANLSFSEVVL
ncbi:MAG: bifunctional methylenetetrahydrofolate dehydrogenase/methenyltetrahydrofolate cyclohydrolase FolD [Gammaproteobacteria bacterium]|nr:MAG: bifunctional methylenetetrahydrofolate dehydrogenase/methenyltetrahydrofolate cyclohydrolase FolD [Gammaproteobacteria bacterium]